MGSLKCFSPTISLADQLSEAFSCFYPESEKNIVKEMLSLYIWKGGEKAHQ